MKQKLNIGYIDLLKIIDQLPESQLYKLKSDLSKRLMSDERTTTKNFQKLLLMGPIMTDNQYEAYKESRKQFNKWTVC